MLGLLSVVSNHYSEQADHLIPLGKHSYFITALLNWDLNEGQVYKSKKSRIFTTICSQKVLF